MNYTTETIKLTGIDAIRITQDNKSIVGKYIIDCADKKTKNKAHRDAMQVIPDMQTGLYNTQFAGAMISNVEVRQTRVDSDGKLQCLFCSDGGIHNTWITDNVFNTSGAHFISLCLFSGHIENNRDSEGRLVPVRLFPLRIGGNSDGLLNVFILSFINPAYQYRPANEIIKDSTLDHVTDHRFGEGRKKNSIYLVDFDLDGYVEESQKRQLTADEMRELALIYGTEDVAQGVDMNKPIMNGLLRHILTTVGGLLVANGLADETMVNAAVGVLITLVGMFMSYKNKVDGEPSGPHANAPIIYTEPEYKSTAKKESVVEVETIDVQKGFFLGERSIRNLQGVNPKLRAVIERGIVNSPFDFTVVEGLRSKERQEELLRKQPAVTKTKFSKHLEQEDGFSHAVDLYVMSDDFKSGFDDRLSTYKAVNDHLKQVAREEGVDLEWGGNWKSLVDGFHWQINI